jgi:hypothetical protein
MDKCGLMGRCLRCAAMMDSASFAGMDSVLSGRYWLKSAGVLRTRLGRTTTISINPVRKLHTIEKMSLGKT